MKKIILIIYVIFGVLLSLKAQTDVRSDVYTPNGSQVEAYIMYESSTSVRASFDNYYSAAYPNAQ
jgi:hypothetical protein